MAWQNLFDTGSCDVWYAMEGSGGGVFSGMSKGQSQSFLSPVLGYHMTISVGLDGSVTLSSTDAVISGANNYDVWVVPSASVAGRTGQLSNVSMGGSYGRKYGFSNHASGGSYIGFTAAVPAAPNPMTFGGSPVAIGMSIGAS